ncbi:hypothetical protein OTERR_13070 [Oryzomicrobium terrae]|uniref:TNase-like domain-containing protein n=2 Tax=Oryzomicrobium terrae TaxID=1735038 RepID=A0A5C1E7E5_9RHOO|nr:hypothetical protein OTERR_13070 [Oryzomicrobium terrae]
MFAVMPLCANAGIFCRIVGVTDGDTLTALCLGDERVKVRLAEIDAPEKKQPFGARAKESLSDMCFGKDAEIVPQAKDRYGRTVARVICAGVDANVVQVRRGMAWVYDRYVTDRSLYQVQDEARGARAGLWAEPDPVRPWEWRKALRSRRR